MSLRIISTPLTGSALARSAIDGSADATWFVKRPGTQAEWKSRAEMIRRSLVDPGWADNLAPAFDAKGKAAERLERAASLGIAVTTGQQPGLFGGPLYTWWKAISALTLADRLEKTTGLPVVPVFWAATDDSDFEEASSTVVATADGAERIQIERAGSEGTPLAQMPLGDVTHAFERLAAAAGSAPNVQVFELVKRFYAQERTVGGAYVALLRAMLEPYGIPVLDAAHPAVRTAAMPVLRMAIERAVPVEEALMERSRALKSAGHSAQVKVVKGRTLVFSGVEGKRDRIRTADGSAALSGQGRGSMGPNVLLRPIIERSIIPTVAYMGGPGEISYFAQVSAVADALEVPMPLIVPRWSGFVLEPRIERILEKYNLSVEDFRDPHAVETKMAAASLPAGVTSKLEELKTRVERTVEELGSTEGGDLVAPAVLEGLERNVSHRVERLERRMRAGVKRRGNDMLRDAAIARGALFPFETPQERALNIIPLVARYGDELMSSVEKEAAVHAASLA
ncbi:MAG: bacillithiol biosynthesis BshC [Gemmatimonadales bacterium]